MSSLYKKNDIYYLSVQIAGKRITKSLRTADFETVKQIKPIIEKALFLEIIDGVRPKNTPLTKLMKMYLEAEHNWKASTKYINTRLLNNYLKKGYPENQTTKAMTIRVLNGCNRWGHKNKLIPNYESISGGNKYEARTRVYSKDELKLMFNKITPHHFNMFVRLSYYTGARSGEIRCIQKENVKHDSIVVWGKSGKRIVKLNTQAREVLDTNELWEYTANYVQLTWSRNRKRLGLHNARFHDLRRTFGYNLIKQGRPIYEVSKLLGHSSVITTERHYAPLLTTEIEDFTL
jgi:integrase